MHPPTIKIDFSGSLTIPFDKSLNVPAPSKDLNLQVTLVFKTQETWPPISASTTINATPARSRHPSIAPVPVALDDGGSLKTDTDADLVLSGSMQAAEGSKPTHPSSKNNLSTTLNQNCELCHRTQRASRGCRRRLNRTTIISIRLVRNPTTS